MAESQSKIGNPKSKIPERNDMTTGFIEDGYTLDGFVKELPGIYGAVRFKYRPLTVEQRVRLFENWATLPALDQISRTTSALARQIVQWDLKDAKGRPIA